MNQILRLFQNKQSKDKLIILSIDNTILLSFSLDSIQEQN